MMKYKIMFLFGLFLSTISCKQEKIKDFNDESILIYNDFKDTSTVRVNQAIMALPEYQSWEYNSWNSDTAKIIGFSHFEKRKVLFEDHLFYQIELLKQKFNKPTDSFIYDEEIVCYFRVSTSDNKIRILNLELKKFLDLMSKEGREYFKSRLSEK